MSTYKGRNGDLSYSLAGDPGSHGLLLLHSLGAGSLLWEDQLPELSRAHRVLTPDLPGHGGSGAIPAEYTMKSLCMDVLDIADTAGMNRFDLCGISLGGQMAIWIAANRPERVSRLIACNTALRVGTEELWSERIEDVLAGGMEGIRESVVPRFITGDLIERRPDAYDRVHAMFGAIDPVGYAGCCAALRDADLTDEAAHISCPTLLIGGSADISTPPEQTRAIGEVIGGSKVAIIEGAAHLSNIDQPEDFTRTVIAFLTAG